jgi:hypothetical protein
MQLLPTIFTLGLAAALGLPAANYNFSARGPSSLSVGAGGTIRVVVQPADGWHMNLEFPASLSVSSSSGLTLAKTTLKKADAERLDEGGLVFELPVTAAAAGNQTIDGTLKFAVCRDEACAPSKEKIAVRIKVE